MNLVKWLRKNNKKLMAIVVVVLMVGFVGGSALRMLLERGRFRGAKPFAYCLDGEKITGNDLMAARRELEILKLLSADVLLQNIQDRQSRTIDLRAFFLGEVLFSDRSRAPAYMNRLTRQITQNGYRISLKQIDEIYNRTVTSDIYWLLLSREAAYAGISISNEEAGNYLAIVIPQVVPNATYSKLVSSIVNRQAIPEGRILTTFAKLLAVLQYARIMCSAEQVTQAQIRHTVSFERETIDAEYVRLDSDVFADDACEPTVEQVNTHFERFKSYYPGAVSDENPYGFGYKLAERLRLEYIAVKMDDVQQIVEPPTPEDAELYYAANIEQYTQRVPSDPNDPNSPVVEKTSSFAEVADTIKTVLLEARKNRKVTEILEEAERLAGGSLAEMGADRSQLDANQLSRLAGDYGEATRLLSDSYGIKLYHGQTGLLSALDVQQDEYMGQLYLRGLADSFVGLAQVVFAVKGLQGSELGPLAIERPVLYESLGPFRDALGRIMLIARVTQALPATAPESIEEAFSTKKLELGEPQARDDEKDVYSLREALVEDCKKLSVMGMLAEKARELKVAVAQLGWEGAVEKFNSLYGPADADEPDSNSPASTRQDEPFKLETLSGRPRISNERLVTMAVQTGGNPAGPALLEGLRTQAMFIERLYSLVPQDANTLDTVPYVMEFKPHISYYCLKSLRIARVSRGEYERLKPLQAYYADHVQSQSMAVVYLKPANILERNNFTPVVRDRQEQQPDANETGGTS